MSRYVSQLNQLAVINRALMVINAIAVLALVGALWAMVRSRDSMTVYLPPDLDHGATVSANTPHKTTVYAFANLIYQYVNTWVNGAEDYPARINDVRFYLSRQFERALNTEKEQLASRNGLNELSHRERSISLSMDPDYRYQNTSVTRIEDGVWRVALVYRLRETLGGVLVKDRLIQPVLRVVRARADPQSNQWGLVIAGYEAPVQTLENYR